MDDMSYNYNRNASGRLMNNKLRHVNDGVNANAYTEDIDNQQTDNYRYDKIGNLVSDKAEKIEKISWNVYGKISSIQKMGSEISYSYDAGGNRITKTVNGKKDFYVRDAQGNVLALYEFENSSLKWAEQHLYGSSMLGIRKTGIVANGLSNDNYNYTLANDPVSNGIRGNTIYHISNHLGNVMATITDRKMGVDVDNDGQVDHFDAEVLSQTDYYPGGMTMPGRTLNAGSYAYGFNGKRMDNEVSGTGAQYDYGFRIYDPRLVRFKSVDPLTKAFPFYTPYQFSGNSPIYNVDLDGLEDCPYHKTSYYKKNEKGEVVFEMLSDKDWNKREEDRKRAEMGYFVPKENTPNWARPVFGVANTFLTTVGALSELPAQAHYGGKIKPENREHVFPLTGDGNIARLFAEGITAPAYLLKEIINNPGDTEKWGELAGALFLMRKAGSAKTFAATLSKRVNLANDFYIRQGYSPSNALKHLDGINFSEAVQTTTLKKGTVIQQWVREGAEVGDYFTSLENGAQHNLGMPGGYENRTLKQFTLTSDVKVLKSTASEYQSQAGGGVQYFSAELKYNIKPK